jgi:CheY-like chemotaxis protein
MVLALPPWRIVTQPLRGRRCAVLRMSQGSAMTKRILVVDDETEFSEMLQFRLRHLDYEVLAAANGAEALNKARSESPDVILLDLLLPDLDGLTVCEILQRLPSTRETPIILITAVTSEATQQAARMAGASGFLGKPLDFEELKRKLEVALAPRSGAHQEDNLPESP